MCNKIHYNSKANAKKNAKHLKAIGLPIQKPYKCNECPSWHLTTHISMNYKRHTRRLIRNESMEAV